MGGYDLFRKLSKSNLTDSQCLIEEIQNDIIRDFQYSPSFKTVVIEGVSRNVHITDERALDKNPNKKRLLCAIGESISVGNLVCWNNEYWLCTNYDSDNTIQNRYIIEKCNNQLKWYNPYNRLITCYSIGLNATMYSLGINEGKLPTVDGMLKITLPDNLDTRQIQQEQRFIYKNRFAYKVTFIDLSMDGLINLTLTQVEVNKSTDNLELGIADYWNRPEWKVEISEGNLSIANNSTLQLHAVVTKDGEVVNEEYEWVITNTNIATIDNSGLLTALNDGSVNITAKLKGNNTYSDTVVCTVASIPNNNVTITIDGDSEVVWTTTEQYRASKLYNGVKQPANFVFNIDYMGNPQSPATLVITGQDTCNIIANSDQLEGTIKLVAVNTANIQEYYIKTIEIKGFY